jgi:hypothetical protein
MVEVSPPPWVSKLQGKSLRKAPFPYETYISLHDDQQALMKNAHQFIPFFFKDFVAI